MNLDIDCRSDNACLWDIVKSLVATYLDISYRLDCDCQWDNDCQPDNVHPLDIYRQVEICLEDDDHHLTLVEVYSSRQYLDISMDIVLDNVLDQHHRPDNVHLGISMDNVPGIVLDHCLYHRLDIDHRDIDHRFLVSAFQDIYLDRLDIVMDIVHQDNVLYRCHLLDICRQDIDHLFLVDHEYHLDICCLEWVDIDLRHRYQHQDIFHHLVHLDSVHHPVDIYHRQSDNVHHLDNDRLKSEIHLCFTKP